MQSQLDLFSKFYESKHARQKLEWDHALGTMSLKTRFRSKMVKGKASGSHPPRSDAHTSKKPRLSDGPVEEEGAEVVEKELSVSIPQGIVLLMFQSEDEVGFLDIKDKCGIGRFILYSIIIHTLNAL